MVTARFSDEYCAGFSIVGPGATGSDLLERVSALTQDWFGSLSPGDNSASPITDYDQVGELAYRRFQMELPHTVNPGFRLRIEIKLSTDGGPVSAQVESRFMDIGEEPIPPNLLAGPPSLIKQMFNGFDCRRGNDRLSAQPTKLTRDDAENFAFSRVLNPQRTLPIIAVSQDWQGNTPIAPGWLQERLAGLAEVATYDGNTAEELIRHLGSQLACYNGAVRIYQPGGGYRDPRHSSHHFWMPSQVRALRQQGAGLRVQSFTSHFSESADTREFENVRRQAQQIRAMEQRIETATAPLNRQLRDREREIETLRERLETANQETIQQQENIHTLHQQLLGLDQEIASLRAQLDVSAGQVRTAAEEIQQLNRQQVERDSRIESMRQRLENSIAESGAAAAETVQLHSQLLKDDRQIETLRQGLEEAVKKMADTGIKIAAARQRLQERDRKIEEFRIAMDDAKPGVSKYTTEKIIAELSKNLEERGKEFSQLRQLVDTASNGSQEIHNLINEFNAGLIQRDKDVESLNQLISSVDQGLDIEVSIGEELRQELEEREKDLALMRRRLSEAERMQRNYDETLRELSGEEIGRDGEIALISDLLDETQQQTTGPDHRVTKLQQDLAASEQLLQEESDKRETAFQKVHELEAQLDARERQISDLRAQNSELLFALSVARTPAASEPAEDQQELDNVLDAVERASLNFGRLKFLHSAYNSANDYPFQRPDEVYGAFALLQENAIARSQGSLKKSVEDWMQERGCDYASRESEATMNEHRETRIFGGVEMQAHIKIGSGTSNKQHYIRIYFCWDADSGRYLIGHAGEHLPIAGN